MSEPIHPNKLAAMRAQAYPDIIDDNGVHWYMSELTRLVSLYMSRSDIPVIRAALGCMADGKEKGE